MGIIPARYRQSPSARMARLSSFRNPDLQGLQRLCCGTRRHSRSAPNRLKQSSHSARVFTRHGRPRSAISSQNRRRPALQPPPCCRCPSSASFASRAELSGRRRRTAGIVNPPLVILFVFSWWVFLCNMRGKTIKNITIFVIVRAIYCFAFPWHDILDESVRFYPCYEIWKILRDQGREQPSSLVLAGQHRDVLPQYGCGVVYLISGFPEPRSR